MGRTPNTNSPVEATEQTGTGVTPITEQTEATERQELESLDPAAQAGEVSPENLKNDATADSTLEGADTPQIEDPIVDPVAGASDTDDLSAAAAATPDQEQAEPSGPKTHTVKQGETAGEICEKFGLDYITLAKLNPKLNVHCLFAGETVTLRGE